MVAGTFVLLFVIGSSLWVGFDSHSLGAKNGALGGGIFVMRSGQWFLLCLLRWIVGFSAYLATRPRYVALQRARGD
jgi:hypothetical protein